MKLKMHNPSPLASERIRRTSNVLTKHASTVVPEKPNAYSALALTVWNSNRLARDVEGRCVNASSGRKDPG